jgi:hypothetical protein
MKIKEKVLNLILAALCLVMLLSLIALVTGLHSYNTNYYPRTESFLYNLQDGDYVHMVTMMHQSEAAGVKADADRQECYAVARYYEAATYYKAYLQAGDSEQAAQKRTIMEAQKSLMGELSYAAEEIDQVLGLE